MTEIENQIWINEKIETVFNITNDISNWKNLFSEYEESEVLEKNGPRIKFRLKTKPDVNGLSYSWISERVINKRKFVCISKRKNPLYPFKYMLINWRYEQLNGGTLMIWKQKFSVDQKCPINEEEFRENLNKGTIVQMQLIKDKIEKNYGRKDKYEVNKK